MKLFIIVVFAISLLLDLYLPLEKIDYVMFVPGVAAIVVKLYYNERISSIFIKADNFQNILIAFTIPIFVFLLSVAISSFFSLADYELPEEILEYGNIFQIITTFIFIGLPYLLFTNSIFALGEEIGWRGYLLAKLKNENFYNRALIVGAIWSVWHLPIYIRMNIPAVSIVIFILNIFIISIIYAWLFEKNNSIWSATIIHATHNIFFNMILPMILIPKTESTILFGEEGLLATIGYLIVVFGIVIEREYKKDKLEIVS